jgi:hypothetical protein
MELNSKQSNVTSLDNLDDILRDDNSDKTRRSTNGQPRSSIKSLIAKKFQPLTTSTSMNIPNKQKKPRNSFRHFSQFLKRSHSTNTDLSTTNNELVQQTLPIKPLDEFDMNLPARTNNSELVPISEEDNPLLIKSKPISDNIDDSNPNAPHISIVAPSLSKNYKSNCSLSLSIFLLLYATFFLSN